MLMVLGTPVTASLNPQAETCCLRAFSHTDKNVINLTMWRKEKVNFKQEKCSWSLLRGVWILFSTGWWWGIKRRRRLTAQRNDDEVGDHLSVKWRDAVENIQSWKVKHIGFKERRENVSKALREKRWTRKWRHWQSPLTEIFLEERVWAIRKN